MGVLKPLPLQGRGLERGQSIHSKLFKHPLSRYRQLSHAQKKAVLASENSFESWIKTAMEWLWERISEAIIEMLFDYLKDQL
jgi:hypothetical protein